MWCIFSHNVKENARGQISILYYQSGRLIFSELLRLVHVGNYVSLTDIFTCWFKINSLFSPEKRGEFSSQTQLS